MKNPWTILEERWFEISLIAIVVFFALFLVYTYRSAELVENTFYEVTCYSDGVLYYEGIVFKTVGGYLKEANTEKRIYLDGANCVMIEIMTVIPEEVLHEL